MTTPAERARDGKAARKDVPRSAHGVWAPNADRPEPVQVLVRQAADRLPELLPVRYGRMAASPFAFLRGAAAVLAADLAALPNTGLTVQLCGDAHLLNFGVYASPERALLFDLNDFDETLAGPFEWDVKRLAASVAVASLENMHADAQARRAATAAVESYRRTMRSLAEAGARSRPEQCRRRQESDARRAPGRPVRSSRGPALCPGSPPASQWW